ncbi:MAG TPA: AraC family transcriptional regulator [Chthoniobacteraceae bacterium]|nr:AraC family transcriptional regulator [Chthoniobacteraceae bacterium]
MSTPNPAVPLGVRSIGHYRLRRGNSDYPIRKNFVQVFWSIKGVGIIGRDGRPHELKPGMIAFYFPGDLHDVRFAGPGLAWEYRWFTLDGELALPIVKGFRFDNHRVYYADEAPVALFEKLTDCVRNVTVSGEIEAGAIGFEILSKAAERARPWKEEGLQRKMRPLAPGRTNAMDDFRKRAVSLLHEHWRDPGYGVEQIAEELDLHRSTFSRKFHTAFGLSPSDYLLRWRVQNALNLLRDSHRPIAEVARSCGWEDSNYFARCVRKATGMSPSEFRRIGPTGPMGNPMPETFSG